MVEPERAEDIPAVETVYPTRGLPTRTLRRLALEALARAPELDEWNDPAWQAKTGWPSWREAIGELHAPKGRSRPVAAVGGRAAASPMTRSWRTSSRWLGERLRERPSRPRPIVASELSRTIEAALPYRLTGAQRRALSEIGGDVASGWRMTRLLQGDVGSGKTAVAMLAIADAAAAGRQAVLMAPTEILARQHFETLEPVFAAQGVGLVLLTGRDKGAGRAAKLRGLADGSTPVAVGTHALFQDDVAFADLALAVIDEQHRFGVSSATGCWTRARRCTCWPCRRRPSRGRWS
jgi:ATP-dependent DNA helicase RecG